MGEQELPVIFSFNVVIDGNINGIKKCKTD